MVVGACGPAGGCWRAKRSIAGTTRVARCGCSTAWLGVDSGGGHRAVTRCDVNGAIATVPFAVPYGRGARRRSGGVGRGMPVTIDALGKRGGNGGETSDVTPEQPDPPTRNRTFYRCPPPREPRISLNHREVVRGMMVAAEGVLRSGYVTAAEANAWPSGQRQDRESKYKEAIDHMSGGHGPVTILLWAPPVRTVASRPAGRLRGRHASGGILGHEGGGGGAWRNSMKPLLTRQPVSSRGELER